MAKEKIKTKEVVINKCYGGFGLSDEAILELHKLGSKFIKVIEPKDYFGEDRWENDKNYCLEQMDRREGIGHLTILNDKILYDDYSHNYENKIEARTCPLLVSVVKKLKEKSWGWAAELKIVKIPADVDFEIDEYDGVERIDEYHRSWQ